MIIYLFIYFLSEDFEALTLEDSHWKKIARWFQIDVRLQDKKLELKPSQLYTMFVSQGLISTVPCLSFVKCEEELLREEVFSSTPLSGCQSI